MSSHILATAEMLAFFLLLVIVATADAVIPHQTLMRRAFVVHTATSQPRRGTVYTGPEGLAGADEAADGAV
jgi:hypothetical protein